MQRYLVIGFVALLGLVVGLGVYASREENRLADAQANLRQQAVSDAAVIYVENCAVCHGASGEGLGSIPPLDSEALRTMEYDALFKIIARGLYNTPMAAWHQDEGGMLTDYQIDQLVAQIRYADWSEIRELAAQRGMIPATLAVPDVTEAQLAQISALGPEGQLWSEGFQLYANTCVTCHGANGEGSTLGVALNTPEVRAQDAASLTRTIVEGVPGTMMAAWGTLLEANELDALVAFLQHWDQLEAQGIALEMPAPQMIDLDDPEAILALGERLFVSTCTSCHGDNGTGGLGPAINSQQFLSRQDDAAITQAITEGGHRPNSAMPAFGERLTSVEIAALVSYIRSLEENAPVVANPRGTQQGGGGPPWLQATPDPANPIQPGGQGQGQGRGPAWARGETQSGQGQQGQNGQTPQQSAPSTTYRGTVVSVASNALSFYDEASRSNLEAMLGPPWWWEPNAIALRPGDRIALEGFEGEGHMELNWIENLTTGERLDLRTPDGKPVWQEGN